MVALMLLSVLGCVEYPAASEAREGPCELESVGLVGAGESTRLGASPEGLVDLVDGSAFEAVFQPDTPDVDPSASFSSVISFQARVSGNATESDVLGTRSGESAVCPAGPLVQVPLEVDVILGVGGEQLGLEAELQAIDATPDGVWIVVHADSDPLTGIPGWLQDSVDANGCPECARPLDVRVGIAGTYFDGSEGWSRPRGNLFVTGETEDGQASSERFLSWDALVE